MVRRLFPICQPFTCYLPHFGTWIRYLEQNQSPSDGWLPAQKTGRPVTATSCQSVAAGNFPPCSHVFQMFWSWIQLVTLLHVIPSEFFLSSFFLILSTLTAQLNKQKELECDECTACYVHGFYWGKDRDIVDLILDGCWFKFPIWREKSAVRRPIVKNLFEAWDVNSLSDCPQVKRYWENTLFESFHWIYWH